jgi:hypothetical protein
MPPPCSSFICRLPRFSRNRRSVLCLCSALRRRPSQWPACVCLVDSIIWRYLGFIDAHRSVLYLCHSPPPSLVAGGPPTVIGLRLVSAFIFVIGCALAAIAVASIYPHHQSVHLVLCRVCPCLPFGPLPPPCTGTHLPQWWCSCGCRSGRRPSSSLMEWVLSTPSTSTVSPCDGRAHASAQVEHHYMRARAAQEPARMVGALPMREISGTAIPLFFLTLLANSIQ